MAKSNTLAELCGWTRYVGLQIEYSLLERTVERELVPMAADQRMTVLAWSPLRNGLLTGKYLPENTKASEAEGARMHSEMMKGFGSVEESVHATVREIVAVGRELDISAAQVSLAWLRHRPVPVVPIIGARKMAQVEDNLRSVGVQLSSEQLAAWTRPAPFPWAFRTTSWRWTQSRPSSTAACATGSKRDSGAPVFPFLCDYQRVREMDLAESAYEELRYDFRNFDPWHEREPEIFTKLGYIDLQPLAHRPQGGGHLPGFRPRKPAGFPGPDVPVPGRPVVSGAAALPGWPARRR